MTEEKRQSTVQPEQIQGFNSPAEDELHLIDFLKLMARQKVLILTVTSFCTLFSIFYAQSITPMYRATVGLLDHNEKFGSLSIIEQLSSGRSKKVDPTTKEPITSVFERFLFNIRSYKFKQEVFVKGGFQKKFSHETGIDTDQSVSEIYSSTKIVKRNDIDYLELEGSKPKVMLEFLTVLVEAAKENANTEINEIQRSAVKTRINNLSEQIKELHQKVTLQEQMQKQREKIQEQREKIQEQREKIQEQMQKQREKIQEQREKIQEQMQKQREKIQEQKEIARLYKALDMAKRMGIKNNNFDKAKPDAPVWFRYGELALQEEIKTLRSKEETPNNKNLAIEKNKSQSYKQKITDLESKEKEISNTKKLAIEKNKLQSYKQKITDLESKEKEISNPKKLAIEKLKLEMSQTADLPLLKFKVVTIGEHSYTPIKPSQRWVIVGFGVVFGLFISTIMVFLIPVGKP